MPPCARNSGIKLRSMKMTYFIQAFERRVDGSWICIVHMTFDGPHGRMEVARGTVFTRGTKFMGVDMAMWLDEKGRDRTERTCGALPEPPVSR